VNRIMLRVRVVKDVKGICIDVKGICIDSKGMYSDMRQIEFC